MASNENCFGLPHNHGLLWQCLHLGLYGLPFCPFQFIIQFGWFYLISRHPTVINPKPRLPVFQFFCNSGNNFFSNFCCEIHSKYYLAKTMDKATLMDSMDLKLKELLKEVQPDFSPQFTELIDAAVSTIKESIDKIPEDTMVTNYSILFVSVKKLSKFKISSSSYYLRINYLS